jgi:hypothetical protein
MEESAKCGAMGYLIKHTSVNSLCRAIRAVHKGKTFFKPQVPHHLHKRNGKKALACRFEFYFAARIGRPPQTFPRFFQMAALCRDAAMGNQVFPGFRDASQRSCCGRATQRRMGTRAGIRRLRTLTLYLCRKHNSAA